MTTLSLVFTLIAGFPVAAYAQESDKVFNLVEITDFHGALTDSSGNPVAAVLADRLNEIKQSNPERTLIMSGGDLYQGSATSNIMKGVPVQEVMTKIGLEVTALGNHEFDWGLNTIIDTTMKGAGYSIVCSNLYNKNTGKRVFDPYKVMTKDGIKIAIIGGITTETPSIVLPDNIKDYEFRDLTNEINSVAKEIKQNNLADVVLVLVHEGDNRDNATGPIFDMANQLNNVDAIFGGHTHSKVCGSAANTKIPVYIGNSYGKGYINTKVTITKDKKIEFEKPTYENSYVALDNEIGYKSTNPKVSLEIEQMVKKADETTNPTTQEVIGLNTEKELTRIQQASPYGSSVLGNWAADITKDTAGAEVGFQNNGGLRIDIPKGEITVGTMWKFMPFDNTVYKLNMKKSDIKEVLEQAVGEGGKGLQISGIKFTYDSSKPSGNRVIDITRDNGTSISDTEVLTAGAPDFLATGGDGFKTFTKCGGSDPSNDTHIVIRDAFIDWCRANKDANGKNTIPNFNNNRIINKVVLEKIAA
nr:MULTISPECIES: 5'-nucleotidase C-terminal domain-containing protein [unclassified Clostridium]